MAERRGPVPLDRDVSNPSEAVSDHNASCKEAPIVGHGCGQKQSDCGDASSVMKRAVSGPSMGLEIGLPELAVGHSASSGDSQGEGKHPYRWNSICAVRAFSYCYGIAVRNVSLAGRQKGAQGTRAPRTVSSIINRRGRYSRVSGVLV
jgi:hypothetical protein